MLHEIRAAKNGTAQSLLTWNCRKGGLALQVEPAQHGMVQFVAADFEVHLGAIDGASVKILKSHHDFFAPLRFQHQPGCHHHGGLAGHFLPLGLNLRLIEKNDAEIRQLVLLAERRVAHRATSENYEESRSARCVN